MTQHKKKPREALPTPHAARTKKTQACILADDAEDGNDEAQLIAALGARGYNVRWLPCGGYMLCGMQARGHGARKWSDLAYPQGVHA